MVIRLKINSVDESVGIKDNVELEGNIVVFIFSNFMY